MVGFCLSRTMLGFFASVRSVPRTVIQCCEDSWGSLQLLLQGYYSSILIPSRLPCYLIRNFGTQYALKYEVLDNRKNILKMPKRGRIEYFLDADTELALAKEKFFPGDNSLVIRDLINLKLYPAFSNTPKGHALREIWDQRVPKIHQTTKMKNLFEQREINYPFGNSN